MWRPARRPSPAARNTDYVHAAPSPCFPISKVPLDMQVASSASHRVFASILADISAVLDEDVASSRAPFISRTQQCFAVKTGSDSFLDIARANFCRISEDIHKLATAYTEQFQINLKASPYP